MTISTALIGKTVMDKQTDSQTNGRTDRLEEIDRSIKNGEKK